MRQIVPDVNILISAFRNDAPKHGDHLAWWDELVNGDTPFTVLDVVASGFLRIVTNPRAFGVPSTIESALRFVQAFRQSAMHRVDGRVDIWPVFEQLCLLPSVRGNAIPDAYLAADAIRTESELITNDQGFARFPRARMARAVRACDSLAVLRRRY